MTHKFHKGELVNYKGERCIIISRMIKGKNFVTIVPEKKSKMVELKDIRKSRYAQW
jgi:hypothetical protein